MTNTQIQQFATSPDAFRRSLLIDAGGSVAPFVAEPWQQQDFVALDGSWMHLAGRSTTRPRFLRAYLERPRGRSKTSDLAMMAVWALAFATKPLVLTASAMDLDQSMLLRTSIVKLLQHSTCLAGRL